jgi:nucleotide-binding universal stress UspA family protein
MCITADCPREHENVIKENHKMKTKVLVAIDRTGLSELVVPSLSAQVRPNDTEVLVLQVVEPLVFSVPPEMAAGYAPELEVRQKADFASAQKTLADAAEILRKAGFQVGSRVVESEIKQGILNVAAEWGANLIVVASHSRKGAARFLHRSVAQGVVHRAPCSVLVLKEFAARTAA